MKATYYLFILCCFCAIQAKAQENLPIPPTRQIVPTDAKSAISKFDISDKKITYIDPDAGRMKTPPPPIDFSKLPPKGEKRDAQAPKTYIDSRCYQLKGIVAANDASHTVLNGVKVYRSININQMPNPKEFMLSNTLFAKSNKKGKFQFNDIHTLQLGKRKIGSTVVYVLLHPQMEPYAIVLDFNHIGNDKDVSEAREHNKRLVYSLETDTLFMTPIKK